MASRKDHVEAGHREEAMHQEGDEHRHEVHDVVAHGGREVRGRQRQASGHGEQTQRRVPHDDVGDRHHGVAETDQHAEHRVVLVSKRGQDKTHENAEAQEAHVVDGRHILQLDCLVMLVYKNPLSMLIRIAP